jgi:hypothetical protein
MWPGLRVKVLVPGPWTVSIGRRTFSTRMRFPRLPGIRQPGGMLPELRAGRVASLMVSIGHPTFSIRMQRPGLPGMLLPDGMWLKPQAERAQTAAQQAAKTGLSKVLKDTLGIDVDSSTLDLIGKGLGLGLGVYGSNKQADAAKDLASQYMGMGAPYRAELANLNANPSSFYGSDIFQGALQQGSDALSRSLSAKVGNPILNPTALQEMQNYTTRGSLDAFNTRWNQLASAGQLGVSQAAPLGQQANAASGNTYNALGAGLQSVFGNQRDYAAEFMDLLNKRESRVGSGQSGNVFNLP